MTKLLGRPTKIITGFIGLFIVVTFVTGLSYSISTGFAGFWGGLPFVIIIACILPMAAYDYWDECIRTKDNFTDSGHNP
ncbi:MAG: hypothetical protein OXI60_00410 [Acidiferrobacterales bacterium]|nr:hypothetical protein [Acidiferrobacterales bacterium]